MEVTCCFLALVIHWVIHPRDPLSPFLIKHRFYFRQICWCWSVRNVTCKDSTIELEDVQMWFFFLCKKESVCFCSACQVWLLNSVILSLLIRKRAQGGWRQMQNSWLTWPLSNEDNCARYTLTSCSYSLNCLWKCAWCAQCSCCFVTNENLWKQSYKCPIPGKRL